MLNALASEAMRHAEPLLAVSERGAFLQQPAAPASAERASTSSQPTATPPASGEAATPAAGPAGLLAREPEHQSAGGLWPLFALGAVLALALGVVAVLRQRSRRRRAAQDRALLQGSMLSGFPPAAPLAPQPSTPTSAQSLPAQPALAQSHPAQPPPSARVAAVLADDRTARSGRPLSAPPSAPPGSLPPPPSERQWQSQRPPRGHKDPD